MPLLVVGTYKVNKEGQIKFRFDDPETDPEEKGLGNNQAILMRIE